MALLIAGLVVIAAFGALLLYTALLTRRIEAALPPEGGFVDVPGARIHYVERGEGPAVVMIHGILAQLRHFSYALLEPLARDHRVILIDRPGWGWSTLTGPRPGIAAQAEMIAAALAKLGVSRAVLVGHSMGGAVALALAEAHPGLVRGLALIAPFTQPTDALPEPFRSFAMPGWLRPLVARTLAVPHALRTGAAKSRAVFAPDPVPADFALRAGGALAIRPAGFESGGFELETARDEIVAVAARYPAIAVPVAILYGRGDALLDPALHGGATAEAIPGAALTLVEGGHMLPVTWPEGTEAWLRDAMAKFPA